MSSVLARFLDAPEHKRVLGAFRLIKPIGKGGFAPVWLAKEVYGNTELRTVAVKLFAPEGFASPHESTHGRGESSEPHQKRDAIIQEIRALCRVEHPNVVRFYALAIDPAQTILGLVMEYVHGRPLDRILEEKRRLSVDGTLAVGLAVASALTAIHHAGLIHRDIKPANVIEAADVYKLIDFGIAAADPPVKPAPRAQKKLRRIVVDDLPFEVAGTKLSALTQGIRVEGDGNPGGLGFMSGTVGYIDPASLSSGPSPASDLYSLGAMLFECLTGVLPAVAAARAAGKAGLSGEVLDGRAKAPALRTVAPDVPDPLGIVVDSLLDPDPAGRPRSVEAVAWEIERIRIAIAGRSRPLPPEQIGPFRGLGRFEQKDRDVYFGRSVEIAASLEILRTRGLLALVGTSGSGKSSLARAGVLPAVADGALGGWPKPWDTAVVVAGHDPQSALISALEPFLPEARSLSPEALAAMLADRARNTGRGLILLVDQLEELVALASGVSQTYAVDLLARLGAQATPGLRCVVAARRDLLDPILALGALGQVLTRGMLLVSPMTESTWGEVLDQALAAYGVHLEDDALRSALLSQLKDSAATMPLVQFALTELWNRRDRARKTIPRSAVEAIGGISGALEMHAEAVVEALGARDAGARNVMRDMLLALTTPQGTRQTRAVTDLVGRDDPPLGTAVLQALEQARLVVADEGGVTLAHEALLTQWTRLRAWIAVAREDRLLAEEIEREARAWVQDRHEERVFRKRRLVAAEDLNRRGTVALSSHAQSFLSAGRRAERRTKVLLGSACALILSSAVIGTILYVQNTRQAQSAAEAALGQAHSNAKRAEASAAEAKTREAEARAARTLADDVARYAQNAFDTLEARVARAKSVRELEDLKAEIQRKRAKVPEIVLPAGSADAPPITPPPIPTSTAFSGPGEPP